MELRCPENWKPMNERSWCKGFVRTSLLLGALSAAAPALAATPYYVAPNGSDIVYFLGGVYRFTRGLTTCSSATATINAILLNKSGTSGNPILYSAAPGDTPVFDFSGISDSCRITGIR